MIFLSISEEFGCQCWYAVLTEQEFDKLKEKWKTIKGLSCLVPVTFLIEQAMPVVDHPKFPIKINENKVIELQDVDLFMTTYTSHIHTSDDSYISEVDYDMPDTDCFEIEGRIYSDEEVRQIFDQHRSKNECYFDEIEKFQEKNFRKFGDKNER